MFRNSSIQQIVTEFSACQIHSKLGESFSECTKQNPCTCGSYILISQGGLLKKMPLIIKYCKVGISAKKKK